MRSVPPKIQGRMSAWWGTAGRFEGRWGSHWGWILGKVPHWYKVGTSCHKLQAFARRSASLLAYIIPEDPKVDPAHL